MKRPFERSKIEGQELAIAELHSAIFIAIKRPVVAGRNWPDPDDHKT